MVDVLGLIAGLILWAQSLQGPIAYLGVFVVSFVGSASIFLPLPSAFVIFALGGVLNPVLLGIIAGIGAAIGEVTGYLIGIGSRKIVKEHPWIMRIEKWAEKKGTFFAILLFSATPLPDDITGILAGAMKYDLKKFFIATLIGKIALSIAIAYAGFYGIEWVLSIVGAG